jgi:asparagine synthase (glutamine-hydrolysing)
MKYWPVTINMYTGICRNNLQSSATVLLCRNVYNCNKTIFLFIGVLPITWQRGFLLLPNAQLEEIERKKILVHPHVRRDYAKEHYYPHYSVYKPPVSKLNDILYFNTMQQGLGELLHNADRNSMAHSREMRLPFLNHELVEFVFSLPSLYKIHNGFTKYILRKSMENQLPNEIVWRTDKVGYEPPQQQWMQLPAMNDLIMEGRKKLVNEKILNESILDKPIIAKPAYEADNYDWRYFCVANLY